MNGPENIVIVGGGQAAAQAVETLRRRGFAGELTLVGEEPSLPYQRPPLSKKYVPRPIPLLAPVMATTLSSTRMIVLLHEEYI
jgi:NADPH-dependent 2,4-dienoyl-CoA reductase/sulfur reductase-like enzyme